MYIEIYTSDDTKCKPFIEFRLLAKETVNIFIIVLNARLLILFLLIGVWLPQCHTHNAANATHKRATERTNEKKATHKPNGKSKTTTLPMAELV